MQTVPSVITHKMRNGVIATRQRSRSVWTRLRRASCDPSVERGAALLETVMSTGFLVVIAVALNKMFGPVILDAFEKIAVALASVGP